MVLLKAGDTKEAKIKKTEMTASNSIKVKEITFFMVKILKESNY
jgi:hypothetical protein